LSNKIAIIRQELEDSKVNDLVRERRRQLADASVLRTM